MRKGVIGFLMTVSIILHLSIRAAGAEDEKKSGPYKYLQAEVRQWYTFGHSRWRISFFDTLRRGDGESVLEFEDIDAPVTLLSLRGKPGLDWLTLEGTVGFGNIDSGTTVDTDRTEGLVWSKSESDTDGDIFIVDFKIATRIFPWEKTSPSYIDGFVGYQYYREKLHITNGDQVVPDSGSFGKLNSTYEFEWQSFPVGFKGNWSLEPEKKSWIYDFSLNGLVSAGIVRYRGEGVWNLRSDFEQNPSFRHKADSGIALFTDIGVAYQPIAYISLGAGYQLSYWEAWNGTDTTFFSDGTEGRTRLDEVKSIRHGPYISLSGQF